MSRSIRAAMGQAQSAAVVSLSQRLAEPPARCLPSSQPSRVATVSPLLGSQFIACRSMLERHLQSCPLSLLPPIIVTKGLRGLV